MNPPVVGKSCLQSLRMMVYSIAVVDNKGKSRYCIGISNKHMMVFEILANESLNGIAMYEI